MMPGKKNKEKEKCKYVFGEHKCTRETLPGDEHCIFHSQDIEAKKDAFNDEFWKEFERQKEQQEQYDFKGFVFPVDISFLNIEFKKDVIFSKKNFAWHLIPYHIIIPRNKKKKQRSI